MEKLSHFLRQERERKGLTLEEVEGETRISLQYLKLLEGAGEKRFLADPTYLIPSLRTYATFLDFNPTAAVTQFTIELQEQQQSYERATVARLLPQLPARSTQRTRLWLRLAVIVLALGTLFLVDSLTR
jgi:cytoskeleton protein RodZ